MRPSTDFACRQPHFSRELHEDVASATTYDGFADTSDATFEVWFSPDNLQGKHVLFESGGNGQGVNIELNGKAVQFNAQDGTGNRIYTGANLTEDHVGHFNQIIGVLDRGGAGQLDLYLNGQLLDTGTIASGFSDWSGGDGAGLGQIGGGSIAGYDNGLNGDVYSAFDGQLPIYRFYQNSLFTQSDVDDTFSATNSGNEPAAQQSHVYEGLQVGYDAAAPGNAPASEWRANFLTGTDASSLSLSGTGGNTPARVTGLDSENTLISEAYQFNGGDGQAEFAGFLPDRASNATFELWVKPGDLSGQEILLEAGGDGNGTALLLDGDQLRFRVDQDSQQTNATTVSVETTATLGASTLEDFTQIVGTIDLGANEIELYVNGDFQSTGIATEGILAWAGGDMDALGSVGGGSFGSSDGTNLDSFGTFDGLFSIFRLYNRELTPEEIQANFLSQQLQINVVPEPSTFAIWLLLGLVGVGLALRKRQRDLP